MATNELQRVARNLDSAIRQMQNALDLAVRALPYYNTHGLSPELTGLAAAEVIIDDINKERAIDLGTLSANLTYYLRDQNDGGGNTILGTAPLNAAGLAALTAKLGL